MYKSMGPHSHKQQSHRVTALDLSKSKFTSACQWLQKRELQNVKTVHVGQSQHIKWAIKGGGSDCTQATL